MFSVNVATDGKAYVLTLMLMVIVWVSAPAQFGLKAGYRLAYVKAPDYHAIITEHNAIYGSHYTKGFPELRFMHGIEVSGFQRWEDFVLEAGISVLRNRQSARLSPGENNRSNKLYTSINSVFAGLSQYIGPVCLSATLDYSMLRHRFRFSEPALSDHLTDHGWSSRFAAGYLFRGSGSVAVLVGPFLHVHWTEYDLEPLTLELTGLPFAGTSEKYLNFGLSIAFLNSPRH